MKTESSVIKPWNPAVNFYKAIKDKKEKKTHNDLLLQNLLKTNLQLLKNLDLSNTVLF